MAASSPGPTPLDRAAWFSVRALAVLAAVLAGLWVAARLRVVLLPVAAALLIAAPLRPLADRLERRAGRSAAAVVTVLGLVALVGLVVAAAGQAVVADAGELRAAVSEGVDDVESWLVDRGVDRDRIDDARRQLAQRGPSLLRGAAAGAVVAAEVVAGLVLALVLAVFIVRDGDAAVEALARRSPPRRAARIRLGAAAAWQALRRFLRGAALLGAVEAAVIGTAVAVVGSPLALPVAAFTFLAAFVPLVGAVVAGIVAVLAALVSSGAVAALVVAAVAIVVQQFDNDLLAPMVYGRANELHPAAVLLAIAGGTAIAGLPGAILAVPVLAVAVAVARATDDGAVDDAMEAEVRGERGVASPAPP